MDRMRVYGTQQMKPVMESNAHSWRVPLVLQGKLDGNARITVSAIGQVTDDFCFTRNPWAQRQERSVSRFLGSLSCFFAGRDGLLRVAGLNERSHQKANGGKDEETSCSKE